MESLNIKDIIKPKVGYKAHIKNIIDNFKKTINREIPNSQEENLKKLASLFYNDLKINKPIVVNLDIGQGKSTLLLEFIKYMYQVDNTFSSVIVKRTLQEGRELCINAGLKNNQLRDLVESSDNPIKILEDIYYGNIVDFKSYGFANGFPHEDVFVARLLRGFNKKDCVMYKDQSDIVIGKLPDSYEYYSPVLCKNCERICGAKLSKWTIEDHPVMVIAHQRLFLSNDSDNIVESISGRKVLIIDEKIQTKDMGDILLKEWEAIYKEIMASNLLDRKKGVCYKIDVYLKGLKYPEPTVYSKKKIRKLSKEAPIPKINEIPPYNPEFKFDRSVFGLLMNDYKKVNNLVAIEKFLNYGGTTSRSWHNFDAKQFSYIRYINLENYTRHFDKTIILDATSVRNGRLLDVDYQKSDVIYLDGLEETARGKINLYYSPQKTTKHALIINNNGTIDEDEEIDEEEDESEDIDEDDIDEDDIDEDEDDRDEQRNRDYHGDVDYYTSNIELIALEIRDIITATSEKTLIICYRSIVDRFGTEFKFEDDLNNMLSKLGIDPKLFSIRHFGAATTGVNDFKDYKNIIFIGMLNKGNIYYLNKALAIGDKNKQTKLSEDVIDCIQQIGRICVRKGEAANVYMLFEDKQLGGLTEELCNHFTVKKKVWMPKYFNWLNTISKAKRKVCWFLVIQVLSKMNPGDKMSFKDLHMKLGKPPDTVYRAIKHKNVKYFMDSNSISYNKDKKIFRVKKARK